ncbi:hypothetical protein BCD48_42925 [Pseudofrankia sp. BMG5.36]|nr:hypothetical protein BCD48_42925 [Pseudofrankia sp. BMG5.36]
MGRTRGSHGGRWGRCRGLTQEVDHLVVGGLGEVGVELADPEERLRGVEADHLIGVAAQQVDRLRRRYGCGQHDPGSAGGPDNLAGRGGGRPGGDPVVDHDHDPAGQRCPRPGTPEPAGPTVQLHPLLGLDRGKLLRGDAGQPQDLVVDDQHTALGDGAHRQLGLERDTQLANQDDIQRGTQRLRHLIGDRDTTTGQPDNDDVLSP